MQIAGDSTGKLTSSPVRQLIQNNHIVSESSDLITKDDISNEVINSIFNDLKI